MSPITAARIDELATGYRQSQILFAALRLTHHGEVGLFSERMENAVAEQRVIIGYHNADRFTHALAANQARADRRGQRYLGRVRSI